MRARGALKLGAHTTVPNDSPFPDHVLGVSLSDRRGMSLAATQFAEDGIGFNATSAGDKKFYVLKNLTVLAEYKSPAAQTPLNLFVLNDLAARQGKPDAGSLPQSTPTKAMKLLGRSSRVPRSVAENNAMVVLESPADPLGTPMVLDMPSVAEASGVVKYIKSLQTTGKRRRDSVVRRLVEDHDNELDDIQADLEEAVASLKAMSHTKSILKRALASERHQTWKAVEALRGLFRHLGQPPPELVSPDAGATTTSSRHSSSTDSSSDSTEPVAAAAAEAPATRIPPPPPPRSPPATSTSPGPSRLSAVAPDTTPSTLSANRRANPNPELHSVVSALQSICDSGMVCPTATLESAVRTAKIEERRRILDMPQAERDLVDLTRFLALYDPPRAASAAEMLEPFQREDRTHVLFRLLEEKYKRPVAGSSLLPSGAGTGAGGGSGGGGWAGRRSRMLSAGSAASSSPLLPRRMISSTVPDRLDSGASGGHVSTVSSHADHDATPLQHKLDLYNGMMPAGLMGSRAASVGLVAQPSAVPSPPRWVDDTAVKACQLCGRTFGLLHRRHHCRACGRVMCSDCAPSNARKRIPELGYFDPVRHCKDCFILNDT